MGVEILEQATDLPAAVETTSLTSITDNGGSKFLTFVLGQEEYGLEILKVREIFGYMNITSVPQTPSYVKGVINLRGKVIPVVNLRSKFGMPEIEVSDETCIIVVDIVCGSASIETGIVVDKVSEVLDILGSNIEPPPQFGNAVDTKFILGMGKVNERVKILLDINAVLGEGIADFEALAQG